MDACGLTVKLRGRPEAPDWSRGCILFSRTRGDTTDVHGPLQRLLDGRAEAAVSLLQHPRNSGFKAQLHDGIILEAILQKRYPFREAKLR